MTDSLHFEDLKPGDQWTTQARTVTETDVVNFACLTGDFDPLHIDHEFAKQTPFGRPLAHGLLGLSFVAGLTCHCPPVRTLAFCSIREWQFLAPIFIGDTVHVVTKVTDKHANGRRSGRVIWSRQVVNQKGDVVQSGILETLVAVRDPKRRGRNSAAEDAPSRPHMLNQPVQRSNR